MQDSVAAEIDQLKGEIKALKFLVEKLSAKNERVEQTLKCAEIKHKFQPFKEATTLESATHDGCPYVYLKHGYKCTGCGLVTQM